MITTSHVRRDIAKPSQGLSKQQAQKSVSLPQKDMVSFDGWKSAAVNKAAEMGANPQLTILISTIATGLFRPLITMIKMPIIDRNTDDKERVYSAAWQGGIAAGGLATQLALNKHIENVSFKVAEGMNGSSLKDVATALSTPAKAITEKELLENFIKNDRLATSIQQIPDFLTSLVKPGDDVIGSAIKGFMGNQYSAEAKKAVVGAFQNNTIQNLLSSQNAQSLESAITSLVNAGDDHIVEALHNVGELIGGKPEKLAKAKDALVETLKKAGQYTDDVAKLVNEDALVKGVSDVLKNRGSVEVLLDNPHVIENIRKNGALVETLAQAKKAGSQAFQKLYGIKGAGFATNLLLSLVVLTGATALVTKYMDPILEFGSKTFRGKPFRENPEPKTPEQIAAKKRLDQTLIGAVAATAAFIGTNLVGRALNKGPIASNVVKDLSKSFVKMTHLDEAFKGLHKMISKQGKNVSQPLGNINNYTDKGVELSVGTNLIMRCGLLAQQGEWYALVRAVIDEVLALGLLKKVETGCKALQKPIANFMSEGGNQLGKNHDGVKTISDQLIKNVAVVGIAMGFLNNIISGSIMMGYDAIKKLAGKGESQNPEDAYKEIQKQFTPIGALELNQDGRLLGNNTEINTWLSEVQNKPVNSILDVQATP